MLDELQIHYSTFTRKERRMSKRFNAILGTSTYETEEIVNVSFDNEFIDDMLVMLHNDW